MNQPAESPLSATTRKPVTYHHVLNASACQRGEDTVARALCGHTFPFRRRNLWHNADPAKRSKWVFCEACRELELLDLDLLDPERPGL